MFREDELRENNDGTHRVFNNSSIRVSYKIEPFEIFIVRVVYSNQEPNLF